MQRCVKGDALAWDEFISRYSRLIYNYIHSILRLHGINHPAQDSVSDLFQEIFLSLLKDDFRKLRTFKAKNGCSLASWLRQVTVNHTIDYLRKTRGSVSLEEEDSEGTALKDRLVDGAPTPQHESVRQDKLAHLEDCISRLEIDDRYFLELHLNRGFSLEELKEILKIGRGAVDMRKLRIIERLRDCFRKKGFAMPRKA